MKDRNSLLQKATALVCAWLFCFSPAAAQQGGRVLPVDEMAQKADVVGVATVDSAVARAEPKNGFIMTDFHLTFSEVWKGQASPAFVLMKPGGTADGRVAAVPGHEFEMKPGEKIVVFATPSSLGNHVVMGLRQGLYRVGPGVNPPLFRVSEFPKGLGTTSNTTLEDLKSQVFAALGKPVEKKLGPEKSEAVPEKKSGTPETAPASEKTAVPPATTTPPPSEGTPRWMGGVIIVLLLAALAGVLLWKRKASSLP